MKNKRYHFAFGEETDALIRRISKETDLKLCAVVKQAVEMFAKAHDSKKNGA